MPSYYKDALAFVVFVTREADFGSLPQTIGGE
jgi:hypothetical protein